MFAICSDPAYINHEENIDIHGNQVYEILFDRYIDENVILNTKNYNIISFYSLFLFFCIDKQLNTCANGIFKVIDFYTIKLHQRGLIVGKTKSIFFRTAACVSYLY
jgi:hypothetical protein